MPTYTYACRLCEHEQDEFRSISQRHDYPAHCGVDMKLVITGAYVSPDITPYYDDNLQCGIQSRQHKKEVMREQGVADRRDYRGHKWKGKRSASM